MNSWQRFLPMSRLCLTAFPRLSEAFLFDMIPFAIVLLLYLKGLEVNSESVCPSFEAFLLTPQSFRSSIKVSGAPWADLWQWGGQGWSPSPLHGAPLPSTICFGDLCQNSRWLFLCGSLMLFRWFLYMCVQCWAAFVFVSVIQSDIGC